MTASKTIVISPQIAIPRRELRFSFVRSAGPGGQNVNKVASKAVLRWRLASSPSISDALRNRLLDRLSRRMNERGELVLTSQRYRDQGRNVADCLEKFRTLILAAAKTPRPRKKTRPPQAAHEARLRAKRAISGKKRRRGELPENT